MDIHFEFELEEQLLVVTTSGPWHSHEDSVAMCNTIREVAHRHHRDRVLWLDDTVGRPITVLESHISGEAAADAFRCLAVVYVPRYELTPELRQRLDFLETVAKNRGLRGQVCLEEEAAREWLSAVPSSYFAMCDW
ncbi:hypothetical protein LOC68_17145 [Blastopirellula sp. JC732]|uniref:Uncharacterized protein n=1 Tax=Blastopirellula sediminis TaxID=2894196 RepID=A0A9X1MPM0_9BACT|nr:hypothetical protein [Blastopirellula sediminis]MCC9606580.1 hypothetical protein [Blastopirellula sediminis]MCC9630122.1 hypothetical protein [Blastopirellula sediminis]